MTGGVALNWSMNRESIEIEDFDVLVEHLRKLPAGLVTFDGCDGAGKTFLARAAELIWRGFRFVWQAC
ncbi:hypothetical protein ATN79_48660 [Paraburkholderia caribensis]|nr:hypothetical protein ATN79_48660 [Paraburkholderia caribensis]